MASPRLPDTTLPALGDRIWYRLRSNAELIQATVVNSWTDDHDETTRLSRPKHGTLHLEVELDPETHHSSGERGLRLDAAEGNEPGQWQRTKPADEDKRFADLQYRREIEVQLNRERAVKSGT
jgi:hypothetical protein